MLLKNGLGAVLTIQNLFWSVRKIYLSFEVSHTDYNWIKWVALKDFINFKFINFYSSAQKYNLDWRFTTLILFTRSFGVILSKFWQNDHERQAVTMKYVGSPKLR